MRLIQLLCALALAAGGGLAAAQPNFSHVEVGYLADVDFDVDSGDGLDLHVRDELFDTILFHGYVEDTKGDDTDLEVDRFGLAFGLTTVWLEKLGVFATVGYEDLEIKAPVGEFNDKGYGVEVGARYPLMEGKLELGIEADYDSYDHSEGRFFELMGAYQLTPRFAGVLSYATGEFDFDGLEDAVERDDIRVALRMNF